MSDGKVVVESTVGSFPVYGATWSLVPGEQLDVEREPGNPEDSLTDCIVSFSTLTAAISPLLADTSLHLTGGRVYTTHVCTYIHNYRIGCGPNNLQVMKCFYSWPVEILKRGMQSFCQFKYRYVNNR